jgi:hypothetical protein
MLLDEMKTLLGIGRRLLNRGAEQSANVGGLLRLVAVLLR